MRFKGPSRGVLVRRHTGLNLPFFILGAALALALLGGCGNSSTSTSTNGSSSNSNASLSAGCGSNFGSNTKPAAPSAIDVVTYHYDNLRTGQNISETILTSANVNPTHFGKVGEFTVAGRVDAQPLYLSNVSIPSVGTRNVLYVATEHGCVFAFDADSISGSTSKTLWTTSTTLAVKEPSEDIGRASCRERV